MKFLLSLTFIFIVSNICYSQNRIMTKYISSEYHALFYEVVCQESGTSKGWAIIYDNSHHKILKSQFNEIQFSSDAGIDTNNVGLDTGYPDYIIYQDYNFDGIKDFAIINELYGSCYGMRSYKIYLSSNRKFIFSPSFTKLTENYCDMFQVNYNKKIISTFIKDGCCWHQEEEFAIKKNIPVLISKVSFDYRENNGYCIETTEKLKKGVWIKNTKKIKLDSNYK